MNESISLLECLSDEAAGRLEEACCRFEQSWQAGGRPRVEDALAGSEGAERVALLRELLLLEVHYRRRAGEAPSAREYQTRFPDATALLDEVFATVPDGGDVPRPLPGLDTIDDPERTGPELPSPAAEGDGSPGEAGPVRFRVLRFHAAGGLGEVFVAEDTELQREVALKEIKPQYADRPESRGRFVLEGEVTGGLEHPGIVPVYGLGTYADGRPYYAMRFIRGEDLAKAIGRFHARAPARFDSLEFRQLLGRFVAVCQAVAYAHSRGVLHRDLKPGNIRLGKFGETLVMDWGLAKVVGRTDAGAAAPGDEGPLCPSGGAEAQTVGVVGTPAFMSPEQAAGKLEELGPGTDVYSLGATLYALLTGRAPFQGPAGEVIPQVPRGAWLPPRQVNAAVPAALDASCRKAMALRPEERYASALALAEDVEHWLADEPVAAYQERVGERLRRWMRKHPRKVTAAAVLLLATVAGLTAGTVLLEQKRREVQESFQMTQGSVERLLDGVSEELWLDDPATRSMSWTLVSQAASDIEEFLKKRPGNREAAQLHAKLLRFLGELYLHDRREREGKAMVGRALVAYEELLRQAPADWELRFGLAQAHHALADFHLQKGAIEDGEEEAGRAITLLEALSAEEPEHQTHLNLLASCYNLRATAKFYRGDVESSLQDNQRALDIAEHTTNEFLGAGTTPLFSVSQRRSDLGIGRLNHARLREGDSFRHVRGSLGLFPRICTNRGVMLNSDGRNAEAARVLQEATAADRWLATEAPESSRFRHGLALALLYTGHVQVELGRPARAETALREALELIRKLLEAEPLLPEYAASRLLAAGYLGEALLRSGRAAAGEEFLREVRDQGGDVLGGPGQNRVQRVQHAQLLQLLGRLWQESGDVARGLESIREARGKLERAAQETPGDPSLRAALLGNEEELALGRFLKGEITRDACVAEQRRVLAARRALANPLPAEATRFRSELAASAARLARLLLEGGRPGEALACVDEVLPDHERFVQEEEKRAEKRAATGTLPDKLDARSRPPACTLFGSARPEEPDDLELRRQWAALLACRGAALAATGRGPEAAEAVGRALALTEGLLRGEAGPGRPPASAASVWLRCPPASPVAVWSLVAQQLYPQEPCYLYDLACQLALASTPPGGAGRDDLAGRAVQALRDYIACGFDNAHQLRTDPALGPLRQRPDFKKLVDDLPARAGKKSP